MADDLLIEYFCEECGMDVWVSGEMEIRIGCDCGHCTAGASFKESG